MYCRLQLYKPSKRVREDQGNVTDVWRWWKAGKRYTLFKNNLELFSMRILEKVESKVMFEERFPPIWGILPF
jgi:hypothetical protein